jgi:hypothetical protein
MFDSRKPSDRSCGFRSFRTLRSRPQPTPVRFTSYAATTRMRRSRSNVFHSARESAYAAAQQHSLPPHTRKDTGSIPVGTTHRLPAPTSQRTDGFEFMDFLVSGFCPVGRALFSCTNTSMRPNRRTVALTADAGRLVMDNRDARAVRALTPHLAATAPTSQPMKYPQRSPDSPIRESTARPAPSGGPEFALRSTARWGPNWSPAQ